VVSQEEIAMFEQAVLSNSTSGRRAWATGLGITIEGVVVGTAMLLPMLFPQAMPRAQTLISLLEPSTPPAAAHHAPVAAQARVIPTNVRPFNDKVLRLPTSRPDHPIQIQDPDDVPVGVVGMPEGIGPGIGTGNGTSVSNIVLDAMRFVPPPRVEAVPVPKSAPAVVGRYHVGGLVKMARLIHRVEPIYPSVARNMRIQGVVELTSVIGVDGRLKELRVLSGHPLLVGAAMEAVKQWIYEPTYLNGDPVEVIAPITVTFKLGQ
jgi:protein TonB